LDSGNAAKAGLLPFTKGKTVTLKMKMKMKTPQGGTNESRGNTGKTGWKGTFNTVMKQHNGYSADGGKVASYATQQQRRDVLLQGFRELRSMGFKFNTVLALRGTHIARLVQHWETEGLSPSTLQNRLSVFRSFAGWIGKAGLVLPAERYVTNQQAIKRSYTAKAAKTWAEQGVDSQLVIEAVRRDNERFGDALALQRLFGLRSKESLLLRPHLADKGQVLIVSHGTKGGRDRFVPIDTSEQRALLDQLKSYLKPGESLVPKDKTYAQWRNHYYYTLKKHGIDREHGLTAHGLRHEHLNDLYQATTGHASPVHGGNLHQTDQDLDSLGRQAVSERAGHSRESISSAYLGGKGKS
jgi:integrase